MTAVKVKIFVWGMGHSGHDSHETEKGIVEFLSGVEFVHATQSTVSNSMKAYADKLVVHSVYYREIEEEKLFDVTCS